MTDLGNKLATKIGEIIWASTLSDKDKSIIALKFGIAMPSLIRELEIDNPPFKKPTEEMCNRARGFIMGLDLNIRTWGAMQKHLDMGRYPTTYYIKKMAMDAREGHITKWDVADCIYCLMESIGLFPDVP